MPVRPAMRAVRLVPREPILTRRRDRDEHHRAMLRGQVHGKDPPPVARPRSAAARAAAALARPPDSIPTHRRALAIRPIADRIDEHRQLVPADPDHGRNRPIARSVANVSSTSCQKSAMRAPTATAATCASQPFTRAPARRRRATHPSTGPASQGRRRQCRPTPPLAFHIAERPPGRIYRQARDLARAKSAICRSCVGRAPPTTPRTRFAVVLGVLSKVLHYVQALSSQSRSADTSQRRNRARRSARTRGAFPPTPRKGSRPS